MIPIDYISVSRISHPSDRFHTGQCIKAVVKSIEDDGKITLSHKELLGTWQENADNFKIGETVSGIVRSIENYGIFIELTPNLAGLAEPKDDVCIGDSASVFIKNIIPEKMKLKLIVIDSFKGENTKAEPKYYCNDSHIDVFTYSPESSQKLIQTVF
jgi:small subunit ribosomal protein S1